MHDRKKTGNPIGPYVGKFLKTWLPKTRDKSPHTVRSYKGLFKTLNAYMDDVYGIEPWKITFEMLDEGALLGFVDWMIEVQGLLPSSCNTRISAMKSFARFVQIEDPGEALFCVTVDKIKTRRTQEELIKFISIEAMTAMFREASASSLRDVAILQTLYASGARRSEFLAITKRDVQFYGDGKASIKMLGKGGKSRIVKIDEGAAMALKMYLAEISGDKDMPVFRSRTGSVLSASGLVTVINKYAAIVREKNPSLLPEKISPHTFRHSIATHMKRAGVDLESIRIFLGHSSIATTMIYAKSDPETVSGAVLILDSKYIDPISIKDGTKKQELDDWAIETYKL